jgi:hypothetical protein
MDIFKTNLKDSVHWLKVAMRQAQSDIKKNSTEVKSLKLAVDKLNKGDSTELNDLIRAARDLREASAGYTAGSDKGEICYADAIHESVDLLIDALDNYEGGGKR